jgi:hypothetical protein
LTVKEGSELAKEICYQILHKIIESILGSNTIDVKPTGSIEMDLNAVHETR